MNQHLNKMIAEANSTLEETRTIFSKLNDGQINWKPSENAWSIAQCIDHLAKYDTTHLVEIEKSIDQVKEKKSKKNSVFKSNFLGKVFLYFTSPDNKIKLKALKAFLPSAGRIESDIFHLYEVNQKQLISLIKDCEELDINTIKVGLPANNLIRFKLGDFFDLLITHQKRHLQQIIRILNNKNFPK